MENTPSFKHQAATMRFLVLSVGFFFSAPSLACAALPLTLARGDHDSVVREATSIILLEAVAAPDIAVVQECAKPVAESNQCLWFGDNPRQGILVLSFGAFTIHPLPPLPDVPKYIVPIQVCGPSDFVLFAVWSKKNAQYCYIEAVVRAVELYQDIFVTSPSVLIGDLNSNAIWDNIHPSNLNHSALVALLRRLGLESSYHHFFGESHGEETQPTYYFQWKADRPYHIDYCFVPASWSSNIRNIEIGSYDEWKSYSDHRPLLVEIENAA